MNGRRSVADGAAPRLSLASWDEWQEAYDTAPERHFFLSPLWAKAVHAAYPEVRPRALCFTFPTHRVVLPCAITRKVRGCLLGLLSMPPSNYGGMLSDVPLDERTLAGMARTLGRVSVLHTLIVSSSPGRDLRGWASFRATTFTTHILDLARCQAAGPEGADRPDQERKVRKARRSGITIRQENSVKGVDAFYRLYLMSCQRLERHTPVPKALFQTLVTDPSGRVKLWLASEGGKDIATILVADDGRDTVYCLAGASDPLHWQQYPNNLLHTSAIAEACERGYRRYDFLPSGGAAGVARFKERFGAAPVTVSEYWLYGLLPSLKHRVGGPAEKGPAAIGDERGPIGER